MFKNSGDSIKTIARVFFGIATIICVILAFVFGFTKSFGGRQLDPVPFFSFLIGGPVLAYVSCQILYGFGELIDCALSVAYNINEIKRITEQKQSETGDEAE